MNIGKVYLVGAGCGDYDLITLRGQNCLKKCDVVVYDSLTDKLLLEYADNAEKYVSENEQESIVKGRRT